MDVLMLARMEVGRLLADARRAKERHRETPMCEMPRTCGGCHFWSGAIAALMQVIDGEPRLTLGEAGQVQDNSGERETTVPRPTIDVEATLAAIDRVSPLLSAEQNRLTGLMAPRDEIDVVRECRASFRALRAALISQSEQSA